MIFGMSLLTFVHVLLSLIGILTGLVVLAGLLASKGMNVWNAVFLISTVLTSVTGFLFPFHRFLPSHGVGILSCVLLAVAIIARYGQRLAGGWRRTYAITAVLSLYLNVFVLVAQLYDKVPALKAMAAASAQPFAITQLVVLVVFLVLTVLAAIKFRVAPGDGLPQAPVAEVADARRTP